VLVTGVFGSGKTSVVEEMAEILEEHHVPYAAIDLDWLMWFWTGHHDVHDAREVFLVNLLRRAQLPRARRQVLPSRPVRLRS